MERLNLKKVINLLIVIISIGLAAFFIYKNSLLKNEISILKIEKIKILEEQSECLKHKENTLKKELIEKYVESMITLRNKIEKGYVPTNGDFDSFFDRSEYIIANLEIFEPSKEEISQHLVFLSSMKEVLSPFTTKSEEKKK